MLHPDQMGTLGKIRYQQLHQEADAERRARRTQGATPTLAKRAGALLIALGQKLEGHGGAAQRQPALRVK